MNVGPLRILAAILPAFLTLDARSQGLLLDYEPTVREVILDTELTQIVPRDAPPILVAGGVFMFRNVRIPEGVVVRGTGPQPDDLDRVR